ncbi:MAG: hypothetical protein ACYDEU_09895, partial [Vulcanimicrobiaceae bacterium]
MRGRRLMRRWLPAAFAFTYFVIPLFPPFITLTAVTIPGVSLLPRAAALALLAIVGAIAVYALLLLLQPPREKPATLVPLLLWLGAAVLAAMLGFDPAGGLLFVAIFGLAVIWHLTLLRYYRDPGVSRAIVWSYLSSGALASLAAIVMVLARVPAAQYTIGHGRAIGTFILPGELAGYLIVFLPIAGAIAACSRVGAVRALAGAGVALG